MSPIGARLTSEATALYAEGVPDDLYAVAVDPDLHCLFSCEAWKFKENITGAKFRAKYFATKQEGAVDLRTTAEGGTLSHNPGSGMYVVDNLTATIYGAEYEFDSDSAGYWYYAFQFDSPLGLSVWSDGNRTPHHITDYLEASVGSSKGPPEDWWVEVDADSEAHRVRVRASRPKINGTKIWAIYVQIKDARSFGWNAINDNINQDWADVHYGDWESGVGEIDHNISQDNRRLTRATGTGLVGYHYPVGSDYAQIGDLVLFDRRGGGAWDVHHCQWATIDTIQGVKSGFNVGTATYFDVAERLHTSEASQLRLITVNPPWLWSGAGYFGAEPNRGWWQKSFWKSGGSGDTTTEIFESDWIDVPIDVPLSAIEGRVWFDNGYSVSDDDTNSETSSSDTENPSGASNLQILAHADDETIPLGYIAFQWNRDTSNYNGIFTEAIIISSLLPAQGPFEVERDSHSLCTIEEGSCITVKGNKSITVTRADNPDAAGKVFLIYTADGTPDSDLDGNIVTSQGVDKIILSSAFNKSGAFRYAIVKPWWDRANLMTDNLAYYQFLPWQCCGDIQDTIWRTPIVKAPKGTFYATAYSRNKYGVGTRITAGPKAIPDGGCVPLIDAATVAVDATLGSFFYLDMTTGVGACRTLGNPSGAYCGQPFAVRVKQPDGALSLTFDSKYNFGTSIKSADVVVSKTSLTFDYLGFFYNAITDKFDIVSFVKGYPE
jgi:hypothetical protein